MDSTVSGPSIGVIGAAADGAAVKITTAQIPARKRPNDFDNITIPPFLILKPNRTVRHWIAIFSCLRHRAALIPNRTANRTGW